MKKWWGVVAEGYQYALGDFPDDFRKLRKKFWTIVTCSETAEIPSGLCPSWLSFVRHLWNGSRTERRSYGLWVESALWMKRPGGVCRTILLVRRVFQKGLTKWCAVSVPGPRKGQGIQRGLMGQKLQRSYWSRWGFLFHGFLPMFSLLRDSEDELNLLLFIVLLPFLDLPDMRSFSPTDMTKSWSLSRWGRSTAGDCRAVQPLSIWRWVYSSVAVTAASSDMNWAFSTVELTIWRSSTTGSSFWIVFLATDAWKYVMTFLRKV